MSSAQMKAAICTAYGAPEVLQVREVDRPSPKANEVLVRIKATAVNSGDVRIRALNVGGFFLKIIMLFAMGFKKPRKPILGVVVSGVVEKTGKAVKNFKAGDEIFAHTNFKMGGYAQYITIAENANIMLKPQNASFEEAAAILFGGLTALYFLNKAGVLTQLGQKVLIYGATGSVGAAAVEIAKHYQAEVTSVCSQEGAEFAQKLGSDHIVIYTQQDYTKLQEKFDTVFDAVGKTQKKSCKHLLRPNGKYLTVGGMDLVKETKVQMELIKNLFEKGHLHANIDKTYTLEEIVTAHSYVDTGRKKANVVIKVE